MLPEPRRTDAEAYSATAGANEPRHIAAAGRRGTRPAPPYPVPCSSIEHVASPIASARVGAGPVRWWF